MKTKFLLKKNRFTLDVDLELPDSGVTVVFGKSGCGKTTFLRCIAGLEMSAKGQCNVKGKPWLNDSVNLPPQKRSVGYVFQEANLFNHLTVSQNIAYGMKRFSTSSSDSKNTAIDILGIASLLTRYPATLSGGERQRVAIARAVAINPQVLLMDEPLSALDHERKTEVLPYLKRLKNDLAIPIVYVTHSTEELTQLADEVVFIENGKCSKQVNLNNTDTDTTLPIKIRDEWKTIIDAKVVEIDAKWHLAKVLFGNDYLWIKNNNYHLGDNIRISVSSHQISIALEKTNSSFQNMLAGVIHSIEDDKHPSICLVHVKVNERLFTVSITKRALWQLNLCGGTSVILQIKSVLIEI